MADPLLNVDFETFMGGTILAMNVALVLYGISTTQAYIYASHSTEDPFSLKALVASVWVLETVHTASIMHTVYFYSVKSFGDLQKMFVITWSTGAFLVAETAVITLVQGFYIRRIWLLSGKRIFPSFFLGLILATSIGFHSVAVSYVFRLDTWKQFITTPIVLLTIEVANALFAGVDGLVALWMIYYLHKHRTGFERTDGVIHWLMGYIVNTGALTMLAALTGIIILVSSHDNVLAVGISTIVSKLYANALLGFLNARGYMRGQRQAGAQGAVGIQLSRMREGTIQQTLDVEALNGSSKSRTVSSIRKLGEDVDEKSYGAHSTPGNQ